jgi:hypothetical protein
MVSMRNLVKSRRRRTGVVGKLAGAAFIGYLLVSTTGTAHASDYTSGLCELKDSQVAHPVGMRINPCAELDTTQVVDTGDAGIEPVYTDSVYPAVWHQLRAMGYVTYAGSNADGSPDLDEDDLELWAPRGLAGALNRIEAGLLR